MRYCNSTVPNPYWVSGLDTVFTLKGSLKHENMMKSEKTGVKWADAPESSIHSGFLRLEPNPLHTVQWLPGQVLEYLCNITESDLERVPLCLEAHAVLGAIISVCDNAESLKTYQSSS